MIGIETSYAHGEPCMYATSGSGRVMMSPSRGTMRSWPVRPGKYARANICRKRCRAAGAAAPGCVPDRRASVPRVRSPCWPEIVQATTTRISARRTAPRTVNREAVATGQSPVAVIVSCSDSRVPPEIVFDQTFGQLFVIRTAGQVIDEAARGSIVYGVDFLKAPLLLVLGHSGCGAVEAAIAAIAGNPIPGYAYRFAESIGPAVHSVIDEPGDQLDNAIRANIKMGVDQLRTAEPDLAAAVGSGQLTLAGGYYDLASGEVTILS